VQSILQAVDLLSDRLIVTCIAICRGFGYSTFNASNEKVAENRVYQDEMGKWIQWDIRGK
jgi:hypothetical protein